MNVDKKFENLVDQYLDERCPPAELATLERLLETNAAARDYYLERILLHENLSYLKATSSTENSNIIPMTVLIQQEKKRSLTLALASAAAVVAIILITLSIFKIQPKSPLFVFKTSPGTHYEVMHTSTTDQGAPENALAAGSSIHVTRGVIELESPTGTKAIIQGPATLNVVAQDNFALLKGTAWFRASEKDPSLLVTTPLLSIRDLGTEFGVMAKHERRLPEVHVFEGKVEVTAKNGHQTKQRLIEGEAAILTYSGHFNSIKPNETAFFLTLPTTEPYLHLSFDPAFNNRLAPVTGSLPCVPGFSQDWHSTSLTQHVAGISGQAARFNSPQSAIITNWPGPAHKQPFSISLWMRYHGEEAPKTRQCILGWGQTIPEQQLEGFHLNLQPWDEMSGVPHLVLDQNQYVGSSNIADGEWHHIIVTRHPMIPQQEPNHFSIYVDGVREKIKAQSFGYSPPLTTSGGLASNNLLIGRSNSRHINPLSFSGDLDELRIYETAISEEEIVELGKHSSPQK